MRSINIYISLLICFFLSIINCLAQIYGCTDPLAANYNPSATRNNGSCIYEASSVSPDASYNLPDAINETSGLIRWNNHLLTHNDSEDINLYELDTLDGRIIQSFPLTGTISKDWEEISQDNDYVYIGDFGNSSNGNRKDLKILRIRKNSIQMNALNIDTINFSYSDQTDFTPAGSNSTDFDCEAFIVSNDSIYLFTKQWKNQETTVYSIPKTTGTYIAKKKSTCNVEGLITGSTYLHSKGLLVLCGYSIFLEPFLYLLYDFDYPDFFSGNKRKVTIPLSFHQVEGIATTDGLKYYMSNERFTYSTYLTVSQKLQNFNLSSFLENYLESLSSDISKTGINDGYLIYPVPADIFLMVKRRDYTIQEKYSLINCTGQVLLTGILSGEEDQINISSLLCGIYILEIGNKKSHQFKVIKD